MSSPESPLHTPKLSFSAWLGKALSFGLLWAMNVAVVLNLLGVMTAWFGGRSVDVVGLGKTFAAMAGIFFLVFFVGRLLWLSRPLQDRAFTWLGFFATFFGLAMLTIFLANLIVQTVAWFNITPQIIQKVNKDYEKRIESIDTFVAEQMNVAEQDKVRDLQMAKTDKERDRIAKKYEAVLAQHQKMLKEENLEEIKTEAEKSIRTNTSPWAVFFKFLTGRPTADPQDAGSGIAILGSLWVGLITIVFAVPVGVGAALYLEEYRTTKNWLGRIIQVNINNLAGVPSVVYGILGAFVFVELIFKPLAAQQEAIHAALQANPDAAVGLGGQILLILPTIAVRNVLGGGLTLGLLTLPVVIVSAQEAIRAVPPSIRHGAHALGATKWQVIWHQVLPMSRSGILTGTILAVSRAIGEAAPLVLFGALLDVQQLPSLFSRFTVMPMQIFAWSSNPEQQIEGLGEVAIWRYNAAVACVVLMCILLILNTVAILLRNRAQRSIRA